MGILALACIGISFNIWFVQNTNAIIESLVSARSNGHLQLQLSKSSFQYFNKKIILHGATFYSSDTTGAKTDYQFDVPKLELKIRSWWAFLAYRELLIDSINLKAPEVTVTRLTKATKQEKANISIPEEIGRIYNSILDALQVLQVKRFQIDDGRFSLVNKIDSNLPVTTISNIHFHINNLKITADSSAVEKFLYSDNVVLRVKDQDIAFPDGVHHMSFKNLVINVRSKQVELDSCMLRAETRNDRNSFHIFFDVLKLANLDFTALYKKNLIKADSVYINNPDINFALEIKHKKERGKKLELDSIIQQFTGDMALGYIGVQNAAVNIVANRADTSTTFSSKNDNFKMYGLRINSDSAKPVYVDEFAMILRKYETYSRDSAVLYRFDSIRFTNNKVRLSNFTIQSIANNRKRGTLFYSIPAFELTGLSWEDLLFDRYLRAEKAVLLNPEIQYSIGVARKKQQRASLFKILSGLNETIDLAEVEIKNGNVNIELAAGKRLNLQHVDLVLASNRLLSSKSYTGMQQAINQLALRNTVFTTGDLRAELINLYYSDRLHADELRVTNADKTLVAQANGISLNDLVWNNEAKSVFLDKLAWQQANIVVKATGKKNKQKSTSAIIELSNLSGKNTTVTVYAKDKILKTKLDEIKLVNLVKKGSAPITLHGFTANGKATELAAGIFNLRTGAYHIVNNGISNIHDISFLQQSLKDTFRIVVPQTFLKPHIDALLKGTIRFENVTAAAPVFDFTTNASPEYIKVSKPELHLPLFSIDELIIKNPVIHFTKKDTALTTIEWSEKGAKSNNNYWTFQNVHSTAKGIALAADKAELMGNKALFASNRKLFGIDSGLVHARFDAIKISAGNGHQWQAHLQEALFKNPISLLLKKQGGIGVDEARLRNLRLSSDNSANVYKLLQDNPDMQLYIANGSFADKANQLQWKSLLYNQADQSLSLDSFSYQPTLSRDSFIANAPGQTDYMHAVLKNIFVSHIDLTAFEKDSVLIARSITINRPELALYRDKRKPFISKGLRPLPALALQNIAAKFAIDTVALKDATVSYTELSERTGQEGSISINRINAQLFPVRNINIGVNDSLALRAEGYVMDSAWLRLRFKESYTDSLGTFAMTLRMKPTNLSVLNPALMPMASIKLASGNLDTITMRAIGNEYFSIGTMQMYYKDLKIQFLKKGSETKKTFLTGLVTFAANNFVIKKSNERRTGTVYFLRNRDRSIFNFLIKTALSGVASSVGAKKNKKYFRQYKRQQKLYKLPPVEFS